MTQKRNKIKAVGLISGGLDSLVASKILINMGIETHGIHFFMPFDTQGTETKLKAIAEKIGITYVAMQLDDEYMKMLANPKFGYGKAFNPCIDCHAFMIRKAAAYMRKIGAVCVYTGEVMGQRPMSQHKVALKKVLEETSLDGYLLRPLSAKLLEPTIPEIQGLIDREKLLDISGRGRTQQIAFAKKHSIEGYPQPAGGCLLTDKNVGRRIKDLVTYGYDDYRDTIILRWGRHFRFNDKYKIVVGKTDPENIRLEKYAKEESTIMLFEEEQKYPGPLAVLTGKNPPVEILSQSAGLICHFSKSRGIPNRVVKYWKKIEPHKIKTLKAPILDEKFLLNWKI